MADYRDLLGESTALGLGLGQSPDPPREEVIKMYVGLGLGIEARAHARTAVEYQKDPAEAFSQMAELMQPPGGAIPFPFGNPLVPENQDRPSRKENKACPKQDLI